MGVILQGIDFEKVVEVINAQAAALEELKRCVCDLEKQRAEEQRILEEDRKNMQEAFRKVADRRCDT